MFNDSEYFEVATIPAVLLGYRRHIKNNAPPAAISLWAEVDRGQHTQLYVS